MFRGVALDVHVSLQVPGAMDLPTVEHRKHLSRQGRVPVPDASLTHHARTNKTNECHCRSVIDGAAIVRALA